MEQPSTHCLHTSSLLPFFIISISLCLVMKLLLCFALIIKFVLLSVVTYCIDIIFLSPQWFFCILIVPFRLCSNTTYSVFTGISLTIFYAFCSILSIFTYSLCLEVSHLPHFMLYYAPFSLNKCVWSLLIKHAEKSLIMLCYFYCQFTCTNS